jgi:hypothetical protein
MSSVSYANSTLDLQWAVCETNIPYLVKKLGFKKKNKTKIKQSTYYDDANFIYTKNEMQLKVDFSSGKGKSVEKIKSTVKLELPEEASEHQADCELDRYGKKKVRRCSMTESVTQDELWTKKQKKYFERYAGSVDWDELTAYGPYLEEQWETEKQQYEIQLEVLYGPNQSPITEMSVKTDLSNEKSAHQMVQQWLSENKIKLCPVQEGKAKRLAQEFF